MQLGGAVQEIIERDSDKLGFYRPACVCVFLRDVHDGKMCLCLCLHVHIDGLSHELMYLQ